MSSIIDIMFIGTVIIFLFIYFHIYKIKNEYFEIDDSNIDDPNYINKRIKFLEGDVYNNLYENLPWEDDEIDEECSEKYMDSEQIIETSNLRKTKMIIW